jgi:hypothetical protein
MFHKHDWKEIARTYAPNITELRITEMERVNNELVQGATTILWECKKCQITRKEVMLGKEKE